MKVLLCTIRAPWPPMGGPDLRSWQCLNHLRDWAETGLFALTGNPQPPAGFQSPVWRVAGAKAKPLGQASWIKQETALPSDGYYEETSCLMLRDLLEQFAPDAVVLDGFWMQSYLKVVQSHGALVLLNAHNVEGSLARQIAEHETYPPAKLQRRIFAARVARVEAELARKVDQVWVCSDEDRQQFIDEYTGCSSLHVVPNAIDTERYRTWRGDPPGELAGSDGLSFLYTGMFDYAPNQRAVHFLIRDLFPTLTRLYPRCRLLLVGANPTSEMFAASEREPGIVVTGCVPDTVPYLRHSSMLLVPLFEGGGTRFKIIEAFAAGLPVVSSRKGAEGLGAEHGKHLLIADTAESFLGAVAEIARQPRRSSTMVQYAAKLVEQFSWTAASQTVGKALRELGNVSALRPSSARPNAACGPFRAR